MRDIITAVTSGAVATNGTLTLSYPTNRTAGDYRAVGHLAYARGLNATLLLGIGFTLTFNTSNITFTYKGTTSIPSGTVVTVEVDVIGVDSTTLIVALSNIKRSQRDLVARMSLGAPAAASATLLAASQGITAAANAVLVASVMDVPRNVVAAWTTTAIITVTGLDEYGVVMSEVSASGTSFTGNKAFKTITSILSNATITAFTAGSGVKLGVPIFAEGSGLILAESQDFAAAVAGTLVGGNTSVPSSSTGDARGTYTPNAAPDGSKKFALVLAVDDLNYLGLGQA